MSKTYNVESIDDALKEYFLQLKAENTAAIDSALVWVFTFANVSADGVEAFKAAVRRLGWDVTGIAGTTGSYKVRASLLAHRTAETLSEDWKRFKALADSYPQCVLVGFDL